MRLGKHLRCLKPETRKQLDDKLTNLLVNGLLHLKLFSIFQGGKNLAMGLHPPRTTEQVQI